MKGHILGRNWIESNLNVNRLTRFKFKQKKWSVFLFVSTKWELFERIIIQMLKILIQFLKVYRKYIEHIIIKAFLIGILFSWWVSGSHMASMQIKCMTYIWLTFVRCWPFDRQVDANRQPWKKVCWSELLIYFIRCFMMMLKKYF